MAYNIPRPLSLQPQGFMGGATPLLSGLQAGMGLAQQAQQMQANRQAQELQQIQLEQAKAAQKDALSKQNLTSVAQGAEDLLTITDPKQREAYLINRREQLLKMGRDTSQTDEALTIGTSEGFDSPVFNQVLSNSLQTANSFGVFTPKQMMEREQAAKLAAEEQKALGEIRKETRGGVRQSVNELSKQASVLDTNYTKLQNLGSEIRKGKRLAVPPALVALVKLGDPSSIVSDKELETAINAPNPLGALQDKGVSTDVVEAFLRKADPLNPKNINVNELLSVAKAQMSANVPSLQSRYAEQRSLADKNLTQAAINSLFEKKIDDRIANLSRFVDAPPEVQQPTQAVNWSDL